MLAPHPHKHSRIGCRTRSVVPPGCVAAAGVIASGGPSMDLGIAGRRALVCAASKGLGRGCAEALAREGVEVTICARTEVDVARTADEIGALGGYKVGWVACDITTPEGRTKAL